jgi:hypothetical protein
MPVIPVNRVVDKTSIIGKMEGQGGGEAQGVAEPPSIQKEGSALVCTYVKNICKKFILYIRI